ncbi:MAG: Mpo1-like protein, partial [Pseudomonadota bacterium]
MSYSSFKEFYPYYLQEHSDKRCRILHYIGSTLVLAVLIYVLLSANYWWLL